MKRKIIWGVAILVVLILFPYFLYRFTAAFDPPLTVRPFSLDPRPDQLRE